MFFGVDSPDLPIPLLQAAQAALENPKIDAAVGPTSDGGYWTLAGRRFAKPLLTGIDWGTATVYDQTVAAGGRSGLKVQSLGKWYDVDEIGDVRQLSRRLADEREPALKRLHERLRRVLEEIES